MQRIAVRAGDYPQCTGISAYWIEIVSELYPAAIPLHIVIVVGVPASIADVAVGIAGDGEAVLAVELLGCLVKPWIFGQVC